MKSTAPGGQAGGAGRAGSLSLSLSLSLSFGPCGRGLAAEWEPRFGSPSGRYTALLGRTFLHFFIAPFTACLSAIFSPVYPPFIHFIFIPQLNPKQTKKSKLDLFADDGLMRFIYGDFLPPLPPPLICLPVAVRGRHRRGFLLAFLARFFIIA